MFSSWLVEGRFARGENREALMDEGGPADKGSRPRLLKNSDLLP
jgi:hypothetical protein